ncbi:hypothetical protein R11007_04173 [Ralstonia holmesii]|nr:hypothetical protein R11007_04173 [Ralstonia sp. LMG 32967]
MATQTPRLIVPRAQASAETADSRRLRTRFMRKQREQIKKERFRRSSGQIQVSGGTYTATLTLRRSSQVLSESASPRSSN